MVPSAPSRRFLGNERFEVLHELGRGGMGVVLAAYDHERQQKVALKTLNEGNPVELLRLKAEFRALMELDHPNLVSLGELFEHEGCWFFSMELVEGVDFISHVRQREASPGGLFLPEEAPAPDRSAPDRPAPDRSAPDRPHLYDDARLRESLVQLSGALTALHHSNRVHRDIKPDNVLVRADGRVVLLDFGLVTQSEPGQLSVGHYNPVGTAAYMAPEQAASLTVGPEADWYAVGVLLYEALTGAPPFTGTFNQILLAKHAQTVPDPRALHPEIPGDLATLCLALLSHQPSQRPQGEDVIQVLRRNKPAQACHPITSGTRRHCFIGRQEELDAIVEAFLEVPRSGLRSVLLYGVSGLGKSELLRSAGRELLLREPRTIILWGRCNERESVSYKAFDSLVDALGRFLGGLGERELTQVLPRNADLLARVFPVLSFLQEHDSSMPARARQVDDLQEVRSLAFLALRELLVRITDRRPLLLVLDDIQWADEDSLKLLRSLTLPPDPPRALLLLAMRTPSDEQERDAMLAQLGRELPVRPRELCLAPLSPEASEELALELLTDVQFAPEHRPRCARSIAAEAAGHPLFIQELVHQTALSLQDGGRVSRLDDVLWFRIQALEEEQGRMVELVSISFGPLRQDLAAKALGIRVAEVFRQAARLRVLHLVRTGGANAEDLVEPYHDRVREAVQARMDEPRKRAWHETLARVLRSTKNVEPERLAAHLELLGERRQAAELIAQAGDNAAAKLAFDRAAELYGRAIALLETEVRGSGAHQVRDWITRRATALANAGRGREAADAFLEAVPGHKAAQSLELKRLAAEQLLISGFVDLGLEVTRQVLRSLGMRMATSSFGAMASLGWRRFVVWLRGIRYKERDETEIPQTELVRVDVLHSVARGLAGTDHIRGADFNTRFLLAALRVGEPSRILAALTLEASFAASITPESSYALKILAKCEEIQRKLQNPGVKIYTEASLGYISFLRGDWADGLRHAENSSRVCQEFGGKTWERGMMNNQIIWSLFYLGELGQMSRRWQVIVQDARERGDLFSSSGMILGLGNVVLLNEEGASQALESAAELVSRWSVHGYHFQHYLALLAMVNAHLYDRDSGRALERVRAEWGKLKRSQLLHVPSIANEGLHLRTRATLAAALDAPAGRKDQLLAQAHQDIVHLRRSRLPWVRAVGLLVEAAYLAQTGSTGRAVACLQEGVVKLEAGSMALFAAAARIRLGTLVGGREGDDLTRQGRAFYQAQGVRDGGRMTDMLATGFPPA